MLTIGAFSRASRLTPKALRLYDELRLLPPARVDPVTGYRLYTPAQLERARLVAWLRRLGMPLARIREVCAYGPRGAAEEIAAYWAQVEADTAARRDLAAFLVDQLNRKDTITMPTPPVPFPVPSSGQQADGSQGAGPQDPRRTVARIPLRIRYAARSDIGLLRESNQDTAYAGERLLAVADGYGAAGDSAGAAAVEALRALEDAAGTGDPGGPRNADLRAADRQAADFQAASLQAADLQAADLLNALQDAVEQAHRSVRELAVPGAGAGAGVGTGAGARGESEVGAGPGVAASGTTLTAMFWTGSQLALVHVGDSRAYLLRGGRLFRITHDHTHVQSLVDEGRLTPDEALTHPNVPCCCARWDPTIQAPTCGCTGPPPATAICCAPTACPPWRRPTASGAP
ncbi:MerR family transcriptional regulator [Streptomyces sp. MST-110588]|nr:MerR family transcriptional regulator [Streptomyces sp. MST-110588]